MYMNVMNNKNQADEVQTDQKINKNEKIEIMKIMK
jgi:hypothetical protein